MGKVFSDANEKYVKTVIVYASAAGANLTYDAEGTKEIPKADLENLFLKGMVVKLSADLYKPVKFVSGSTYCSVVTGDNKTFYSAEHSAE